jgi:hypothetical protein
MSGSSGEVRFRDSGLRVLCRLTIVQKYAWSLARCDVARKRIAVLTVVAATAAVLLLPTSCGSTRPNRDPTGERFPSVVGESLAGEEVKVPEDLRGKKALLLVGYVQETQFDIDRWLLGLLQAEVPVRILEIPTIEGLAARLASGWIDGGMRRGIPEEDWSGVVTVYGDAARITELTGTENPRNTRAILLDERGEIVWFHDRGYSPRLVLEIDRLVRDPAPVSARPGAAGTDGSGGRDGRRPRGGE